MLLGSRLPRSMDRSAALSPLSCVGSAPSGAGAPTPRRSQLCWKELLARRKAEGEATVLLPPWSLPAGAGKGGCVSCARKGALCAGRRPAALCPSCPAPALALCQLLGARQFTAAGALGCRRAKQLQIRKCLS